MCRGQIHQIGTAEDIQKSPATPFVASFIEDISKLPAACQVEEFIVLLNPEMKLNKEVSA